MWLIWINLSTSVKEDVYILLVRKTFYYAIVSWTWVALPLLTNNNKRKFLISFKWVGRIICILKLAPTAGFAETESNLSVHAEREIVIEYTQWQTGKSSAACIRIRILGNFFVLLDLKFPSIQHDWLSFAHAWKPPHPNARAKSLPVPKGRTPTGGAGLIPISSMVFKTQPAVPSPPHTKTCRFRTSRNFSSLQMNENT